MRIGIEYVFFVLSILLLPAFAVGILGAHYRWPYWQTGFAGALICVLIVFILQYAGLL